MESAQLLLKAGAEVKSRDDAGCTPMHYAAGKHSLQFMLYLTVWGVEPLVTHQTSWLESTGVMYSAL